eukprot:TRINITY_DN751_c0_g1_i3.p1 TRINITY_DN751_c0_g1~~TRINITY_DN751_c0_g1_i3.p1  ORF type:complete len:659 (-),score=54.33 TRINITY_DN751_c0_g1_i3:3266-5242(-)
MGGSVSRSIKRAHRTGLLDLSELHLPELPVEVLKLTDLSVLYLTHNEFATLPTEIAVLTALKVLYLHNNRFDLFPSAVCALTSLTWLNLNNNAIEALPLEIGKMCALKELYIRGNALSCLPTELGMLKMLSVLYLYENQLNALPASVGNLCSLTEISLHSNKLTELPPTIGRLTALTKCDLGSNLLLSLPPEMGSLVQLREVFLDNNCLEALPVGFFSLSSLELLGLSSNKLAQLPDCIGNLTSLTVLNLNANVLTGVPPEISRLSSLARLDLSCNCLEALPHELGVLKSLNHLNLDRNPLRPPLALVAPQGLVAVLAFLNEMQTEYTEMQRLIAEVAALRTQLSIESSYRAGLGHQARQYATPSDVSVTVECTCLRDSEFVHIDAQELEMLGMIGEGFFSQVWCAKWRGIEVAVKRLKLSAKERKNVFCHEVMLWSRLRHPHIALFLGACDDELRPALVLEFVAGGTLYQRLRKSAISFVEVLHIARQLALALQYLHSMKPHPIIHRDLSSHNVLLDLHGNVKLSDFGESRVANLGASERMTGSRGNFLWMAPEVFKGEVYDASADIFSYGLVLWELATGDELFAGFQPANAAASMAYEGLRPIVPSHLNPELGRLLPSLWHADASRRPSCVEIVHYLDTLIDVRKGQRSAYAALPL